ncbi:MAG TPA: glycosyltransferase family 39 protein [Burkholderiales bacterium]|nr:glycosyltransferase family 39 protein [Burkholderiales bacterium]
MRFLLIAALAAAWFGTLGLRPLYKADETRYAEIPREMVVSGDWITPRLNGFKYFEKPPLQYWATASFYKALGTADWTSRLWAALLGFAGILLVLKVGNRLFGPPAGMLAAAVLAGSPVYVAAAQINTLDMGLAFFLSGAAFALVLGFPIVFWACCAFAVLSKGLVGIVLPLATLGLYIVLKRDWKMIWEVRPISGPVVFLLIAAPWFVAVSLANPEFAHFFFIQEHFQRFTTEVHQRTAPFWFFLPVLALGFAPLLVPAAVGWWRGLRSKAPPFDAVFFLALWALVVLAFFSASSSKLPAYILPMFPPLALLAGRYLAEADRKVVLAQGAIVAALGIAAALILPGKGGAAYAAYVPWLAAAGAVAAFFGILSFWKRISVFALAAAGLLATQLAIIGHGTISERFTAAALIASIEPKPPVGVPVYAVDIYDHSLPWYLRRTVTMVAYRDEFGAAIDWDRSQFVPTLDAFERGWPNHPEAYAFIGAGEYEKLAARLPMQVIARDTRYVFVRKP